MMEHARQKMADAIAPKKKDKAAKERLDEIKNRVKGIDNDVADREDIINLAYVKNRQWITWDKYKKQVVEPPKPDNRTQHTENRMITLVQRQKARIFRNRPVVEVIPGSNEVADIESARIGKRVLEWLDYSKGLQKRNENTVLWGLVTRIAFIHPYWNSGLGRKIPDPETGEVVTEGDIDYDVLSCFEVKYDNSAQTWEDVRWACKIKVRDIDHIEQVYGKKIKPEQGITANNIYDTKMAFAQMTEGVKYTPLEHHARVFEYWELPCEEYPNGSRVTYTENSDEPLFESDDIGFGEMDDTERQLPFFPFVAIDLPGCVAGTNKVTYCRPIQKEINRTRSQLIDNKDLTAYPKLAVEMGTLEEDWDNSIGGMIEYPSGGKPPGYIQPPQAGADAYQNMQQLMEAFDFVSGMSQVSNGRVPSDASGYMVQLLIEQDDTELAPTIENWIRCEQAYKAYSLKMIHFRYGAERTLKIVGKDGVEVLPVTGSSINTWDVRLQRGSLLSSSPVARRAEVMNLVNIGVLHPQADRDEILRRLEFGMMDDMYNDAELDQRQARKEVLTWESGSFEPDPNKAVRDFFNHRVHIRVHNQWRKTQSYEQLPEETRQIIDMHIQMHEMFLQLEAMKNMEMMMPPDESGEMESAGTPHNPENLMDAVANGEPIGNSMQGAEPPPMM